MSFLAISRINHIQELYLAGEAFLPVGEALREPSVDLLLDLLLIRSLEGLRVKLSLLENTIWNGHYLDTHF